MKIVHIISSPRAEGTPRLVLDLLDTGIGEQHVIFLMSNSNELLPDFESRCPVYFLKDGPGGFARIAHLKNGIYEICKDKNFDVAICWNAGWSQWVQRGTRKAGIKKLLSHAGNPPYGGFVKKYIYTLLTYWFHVILDGKIVVPSNYIQRQFVRIPSIGSKRVIVIPNCAKTGKFVVDKRMDNPGKVIMVGTLEDHKDHETLLKAWKIVESKRSDATLTLVGDGRLKEKLIQRKEELQLQRVSFLGSRKDVPQLLWNSDVFAFATTSGEGFGTVLLEALAAGLKVVATDAPACREVLVDGKFGKLTAEGNAELMAAGILETLDRKLSPAELQAQIAHATQYSPESMINSYLQA